MQRSLQVVGRGLWRVVCTDPAKVLCPLQLHIADTWSAAALVWRRIVGVE